MTNKAAQELGRLGGLARSEAKARATRANGKLGGRPRKRRKRSRHNAEGHFRPEAQRRDVK